MYLFNLLLFKLIHIFFTSFHFPPMSPGSPPPQLIFPFSLFLLAEPIIPSVRLALPQGSWYYLLSGVSVAVLWLPAVLRDRHPLLHPLLLEKSKVGCVYSVGGVDLVCASTSWANAWFHQNICIGVNLRTHPDLRSRSFTRRLFFICSPNVCISAW